MATDLDGTLLDSRGQLSGGNRDALETLGRAGVLRVIATGRSLFSFRRALPMADLPVDYLICSSGAGIMDLRTGEFIRKHSLSREQLIQIAGILIEEGVCFTVQHGMPDSHQFHYHGSSLAPPDFFRRLATYEGYGQPLDKPENLPQSSQFLAILEGGLAQFTVLAKKLHGYRVIRTTSPIDHNTLWMEVFPPEVGKGKALEWIAWTHGITQDKVVAVGNDFNDLDMLDYAGQAFVTANAPVDM
ncbi:MAG: HAD family phosphatase, partial [Bacteroidales bacterium]|nr:HAD family phosphatase [Bacteroidales bacterium]